MNGNIEAIIEKIIEKDVELSHTPIADHPKGEWVDGYFEALEWVLDILGFSWTGE